MTRVEEVDAAERDRRANGFVLKREVQGFRLPECTVPEEVPASFEQVADVEFYFLPEPLRSDLTFLETAQLGDCELVTRYLVRELTRRGCDARPSFGLLLSSPYSLEHYWPEIQIDGRWTAFDPHLINSLVRWGVLESGQVAPHEVLDGAFYRLGDKWKPLMVDMGIPARTSLLTRRITPTDSQGREVIL